ncbi:MAG: hypothetical protein Q7R34_01450 [Dehalococcoidia bacterium]|nr:hypothetical protein [Dehalococcoidia bacterium]
MEYKDKYHARFLLGEQAKKLTNNLVPVKIGDKLILDAGSTALAKAQDCDVTALVMALQQLGAFDAQNRIVEDMIEDDGNRQNHRDARVNYLRAVRDFVVQALGEECGCKEQEIGPQTLTEAMYDIK